MAYNGMLGGFGDRLQGVLQSDAWGGLLEGLSSGDNTWQGLARAGIGYSRGARNDSNRAMVQAKEEVAREDEAGRRRSMNDWLRQRSGLDPADQSLLQSDPGLARDYVGTVLQPKEYKPPVIQEFFDETTGQPVKKQWDPGSSSWVQVGGVKQRSEGMQITTNPDGSQTISFGGAPTKLTEGQSKDVGYLTRAVEAVKTLDANEAALTSTGDSLKSSIPGIGNMIVSTEYQVAQQAGREFLAAVLRKDTGAAVTAQEMDVYGKMYLPQPGDAPQVLEQKRVARARALEGIRRGLGPAQTLVPESAPQAAPAQGQAPPPAQYPGYSGGTMGQGTPSGSYIWTPDGGLQAQ